MVCHVEYSLKMGEKKIRGVLLHLCFGLPIFMASLSMMYLDNLRDSLMCTGQEERVWFNIDDFHDNVSHGGVAILLPLHHPFRIFAALLGNGEV